MVGCCGVEPKCDVVTIIGEYGTVISYSSGVSSVLYVNCVRAKAGTTTMISKKFIENRNLEFKPIPIRKRDNVSDHRVRTIDLPFQKHAQAGLRVHRIVICRFALVSMFHRIQFQ
jgi:hypothetical protein